MHDQLRQRRVERVVGERQLLCARESHVDAREALASSRDERLRRINRGDIGLAEPISQLARERTRPAPDIDHALPRTHAGVVGKLGAEPSRVPAHEAVVRIRGDSETHASGLYPPAARLVPFFAPSRFAYARLIGRYGASSRVRANSPGGTATNSFMTTPYESASFAPYFFMNASRSLGGSRSRRSPVGERYVNIFPLADVYGIVAPLRSMLGSVAMSFS